MSRQKLGSKTVERWRHELRLFVVVCCLFGENRKHRSWLVRSTSSSANVWCLGSNSYTQGCIVNLCIGWLAALNNYKIISQCDHIRDGMRMHSFPQVPRPRCRAQRVGCTFASGWPFGLFVSYKHAEWFTSVLQKWPLNLYLFSFDVYLNDK